MWSPSENIFDGVGTTDVGQSTFEEACRFVVERALGRCFDLAEVPEVESVEGDFQCGNFSARILAASIRRRAEYVKESCATDER